MNLRPNLRAFRRQSSKSSQDSQQSSSSSSEGSNSSRSWTSSFRGSSEPRESTARAINLQHMARRVMHRRGGNNFDEESLHNMGHYSSM